MHSARSQSHQLLFARSPVTGKGAFQSNQQKVLGSEASSRRLLVRMEPLLNMLAAFVMRLRVVLFGTLLGGS